MPVAPGIITNGLGGNASTMILGQFNLGFLGVVISPVPPSKPVTGGAGGDYEPYIQPQTKIQIKFIIKRKDSKWEKTYVVDKERGLILIKITKIINTITNKISFGITNIRKRLGNIKVKIWKQ